MEQEVEYISNKNKELLINESIEKCFIDMKNYCEENKLFMFDKCNYKQFYTFIRK